jgi:hypothetical protein
MWWGELEDVIDIRDPDFDVVAWLQDEMTRVFIQELGQEGKL